MNIKIDKWFRFYLAIACIVLCNNGNAQLVLDWQARFLLNSSGYEEFVHVKATPDGGFIAAASTGANGMASQFGLMKLDSLRNKEWQNHYGGSSSDVIQEVLPT